MPSPSFPGSEADFLAYDLFNGDADGICALHQLRMREPRDSQLLTGVKRDIALFQKLPTGMPLNVTALDVSFDRNQAALRGVLGSGGKVSYFDHHAARTLFAHPQLQCQIDEAPDVCTSLLVDRHLGGVFRHWTIVAAYGDNLPELADRMAAACGCAADDRLALAQLGRLLNYNAYGETLADLHFHPADLYRSVQRFESPLDFIAQAVEYKCLVDGFEADQRHLNELEPHAQTALAAAYVLPNANWARRLSGTLANQLSGLDGRKAVAVLTPGADGSYLVSVRIAAEVGARADTFCGRYPGGGGRHTAGGIEHLPASGLDPFIADFFSYLTGVPA